MTVLAIIPDLIFSTKVFSTAKDLGVSIQGARTLEVVAQRLTDPELRLVLIDLGASTLDPLAAIRLIRETPKPPRIICFVSHVETELAAAARAAGADLVLARSQFSSQLPSLLQAAGESTIP